jgi:hypothetical protein
MLTRLVFVVDKVYLPGRKLQSSHDGSEYPWDLYRSSEEILIKRKMQ